MTKLKFRNGGWDMTKLKFRNGGWDMTELKWSWLAKMTDRAR